MKGLFFGTIFLLLGVLNAHAAVSASELKGAMIQRIVSFIEWPTCSKTEIVVGVYNDAQSFERFKRLYQNQTLLGRTVTVKAFEHSSKIDSLQNCDVLYMGDISGEERSKILHKLGKNSVLIVGNSREDAKSGVCVVLLEDGSRYRILINQEALKRANLKADHRLLKLAELVEGK